MKIVYLHQHFRTPRLTGGTRSYEMARRWVANGHSVHVVTSDSERSTGGWRTYEVDGIVVHACAVPYSNSMSFRRRVLAFGDFAAAASARARKLRGDVVFATSTPLTIVLPGLFATAFRRTPMVFEVRDLWPELPIAVGAIRNPLLIAAARALELVAYRSARAIVALSQGMADGVLKRGIAENKVTVAPNSCDVDEFDVPAEVGLDYRAEQSWLGDRPLVVYCGTLGRMNDAGYLVNVAAAMEKIDPGVAFAIYGSGAEDESIKERARSSGVLGRNLFMPGTVPKNQMPAVLSAATVATSLFLPLEQMQSNSANKFFDALAAGRPVAINYGGWQAELLDRTGAGIKLPADDPEEAAQALHLLIRDQARIQCARGRSGAWHGMSSPGMPSVTASLTR
ncbi:MAG TPA: glycosyltransferase family 4 protein [Mycobacterium sp.]